MERAYRRSVVAWQSDEQLLCRLQRSRVQRQVVLHGASCVGSEGDMIDSLIRKSIKMLVTLYWKRTRFLSYTWGVDENVDLYVISEESYLDRHRFGLHEEKFWLLPTAPNDSQLQKPINDSRGWWYKLVRGRSDGRDGCFSILLTATINSWTEILTGTMGNITASDNTVGTLAYQCSHIAIKHSQRGKAWRI